MLKRIILVFVLAMALPMAAPVFANPISDSAVSQLRKQGYEDIQVRRTLLGRIRITANSKTYQREIVIHPFTGEILRDRWFSLDESSNGTQPQAIHPETNGDDDGGHDDDGDGDHGDDGDDGDGHGGDSDGGDSGGDGDGGDGDGGDGDGGDGDGDGGDGESD